MIYFYYFFIFYIIGCLISLIIISYDNWILNNISIGDIKYNPKWALESWYYVYIWIKYTWFD
jgi:hypothetical protein